MPSGEHIHFISAGENIHTAYPAIFRKLPTITRTCVLADSSIYELSSNSELENSRLAIRDAVSGVKEISVSLCIPFSRETISPPVYPSIRTILTKIHRECPGARFTFDLSGGSKQLCMALFAFSPWLDGEIYSAFDEKTPRSIPLPDRSVRRMMENPNYQTILALLLRTNRKDSADGIHTWTSREYIFKQLWTFYVPSRTKKIIPANPPASQVQNKRERKSAAELTHGTLSTLMHSLEDAGLVLERVSEETKREKEYQVTDSGDIAFRFFADPAMNTFIRNVLRKE